MKSLSMRSMASRVCKDNKGVAVDLQSLSLCQDLHRSQHRAARDQPRGMGAPRALPEHTLK